VIKEFEVVWNCLSV